MGTRAERNKEDFVGGFGFGVVEHSHKDVMLPSHHYHPYSSPSSASFCYCSNGAADPIFSASNTSSLGEMFSLEGSNASAAVSVADPFFTLTSSAFSEAQWHELERQRNIFKCMMASLPVPSELLSPFSMNPSHTNNQDVTVARGGSLKLGIASNASNSTADMEPWRCKRTDGKKWRCSRNAVPDQKYCERHAHKSRPRSRKHVETSPHSHHNDARTTSKNVASQFATPYPQFYGPPLSQFSAVSTLPPASSSYDHHPSSGLRWLMKEGDSIATLNPEIHEASQLKVGSSRELKRGFEYDLNYIQNEPLVDQRFGALEGLLSPNRQETRRFLVEGEQDEAMGSSLTLSMAGGGGGGGMEEGEGRSQHQWISHEGPSWLCSTTPGGPLAEALCLGVSNNPSTSTTTTSSCSRSSS
ncbi:hypothetical protein F2Q70_00033011 [Brassica cretica]|uniref:Growth-regulating factor n=1 Tax=Brassica cretica TaxID=69181 RepID=A0A8S9FK42_BRACR|nr:hypothetical protein F2Q70_00033011 [Brassica cretica]KAF2552049.1 hypothetical protein F2Q68_00037376 [Brassica cretica]